MRKILALSFVALIASGCEETIYTRDGSIPSDYVSYAEKFLGTYEGSFNGVPGRLVISLEGLKPKASFTDGAGNTSILQNCGSKIEQLESVDVKANKDNKIERISTIRFAFDAGSCSSRVEGRKLMLSYDYAAEKKGEVVLEASILHFSLPDFDMSRKAACSSGICTEGMVAPISHEWYFTGTFKKL